MALNSTPITWTASQVVTAAQMNAEVRDVATGIQAAGSTWAVSWTGTTNPAIGNGTITTSWTRVGKWVDFYIKIVMGSTTTFGTGQWVLTLPVNAANTRYTFWAQYFDSSATTTVLGGGINLTAGAVSVFTTAMVSVTNLAPFTWATSDQLIVNGRYEAA